MSASKSANASNKPQQLQQRAQQLQVLDSELSTSKLNRFYQSAQGPGTVHFLVENSNRLKSDVRKELNDVKATLNRS